MDIRIGCSGYFYYGWKGLFYPESLNQSEWFKFYTHHFKTVEINSTFYRFPKKESVRRWYRDAPPDFLFSVKVNKIITHIKKFKESRDTLNSFYGIISENLREKLGVFLFQLPPSLRYSKSKLEEILGQLDTGFKNAIEFRHSSWWNQQCYDLLEKNGITFCSISAPKLPEDLVSTSKTSYIRFHGKTWYSYNYSTKELEEWAKKLLSKDFKECFIYFNNDYSAYAPKNALELASIIRRLER